MAPALKDVLLIGYGAVGAVYAHVLERSSLARVTVVARSNYEAAKTNGLHIKSQKYGEHQGWRPHRLFGTVEEAADRAYSHIVLTTKTIPEIQRTDSLLAPFLNPPYTTRYPQPVYVLMQNGMGIELDLWRAIEALNQGRPRIIGTSLYIGTRLVGKDVVEHSYFDRVSMGIYRSEPNILKNSPEEGAILSEFGDMLSSGGTDVTVFPEIQRIKYTKNVWNCTLGPICVLSRHGLQSLFRKPLDGESSPSSQGVNGTTEAADLTPSQKAIAPFPYSFPAVREYTLPWLYDILDEVTQLGQKLYPPSPDAPDVPGIDTDLPTIIVKGTAEIASKPTSSERPSMLVDVELGRPLELEVVMGEVVKSARKINFPIPRLETLYALMLIIQEQTLHEHRKKQATRM